VIEGTRSKLSRRPNHSPDRGSREIDLVMGADEMTGLAFGANVRYVIKEPLFDSDLDECAEDSGDHLDRESGSGRHFDIMAELQVLYKR